MTFYIHRPNTWKAANRKCVELLEFINQFRECLIPDAKALSQLVGEIKQKVKELNAAYPKTKQLEVSYYDFFVSCYPSPKVSDSDYVFTINIHKVNKTYPFNDEGGEQ